MAAFPPSSPSASSSSASSLPSLYPSSSYSSIHSPPLTSEIKIIPAGHVWHLALRLFCTFPMIHADRVLLANLSSLPLSPSQRPSCLRARDQLETLIARHGHPTRVSLSSLEELTATSSTYSPPSPQSPVSETTDYFASLNLNHSASRPIPIPKPSHITHDHDFPVTPLTGRFDKGYYFAHREHIERSRDKSAHQRPSRPGHRSHFSEPSRMRSDSSTLYAPVATPAMSSAGRPLSPQPSRSRGGNSSKPAPAFHLGSLPRFHPAVYQPSGTSQTLSAQPPSPRQPRQHGYRTSASSRDSMWRDLADGNILVKAPSRPLSPSPSAPRLDPLNSPGPVTPLALEDAGGYLGSGTTSDLTARESHYSGPAPDAVDKLIAREAERARQKARKGLKGY
ncbi:hypothetical protein BO99DRAFT_411450 [Aspergillus violaceofuscus CBS 115571]|uniref:Uncharacterized protein n=1 Tax=Aspergillus violaceofuscus (strain CBS 115571) TaxID=1450538 RepID=A0A2V5HH74_ASPV1|nr:hypothetical protein BO99DRAFT_411450 [Aspergillus violaceofuscus CBS 115571]